MVSLNDERRIMDKTFSEDRLNEIHAKLQDGKSSFIIPNSAFRAPVHVFYGSANLFKFDTPQRLGRLALKSIEDYSPNFVEFACAMWLKGADTLPQYVEITEKLEKQLRENTEKIKEENFDAWFAWTVYERTIEKLRREPVEDFRIDFEAGYGIRADAEEDAAVVSTSDELAKAFLQKTITPFCGLRTKSFQPETFKRAVRTLDLFLTNLVEKCGGILPENFVVTLPKIIRKEEVEVLDELLSFFEKQYKFQKGLIKIEIVIETPRAIVNERGEIALRSLVEAANDRCISAHFDAFGYMASLNISGVHQHLRHEACNFARQMMQIALSPLNIRLSDSATIEMPVEMHKDNNLRPSQLRENKRAVEKAWRAHFNNITNSLINGFYQSCDLYPAQLAARYAAHYAFFLESKDEQGKKLRNFIDKAVQANLNGNIFDDAASVQGILNFFIRASSCGALTEDEILEVTNLTPEELHCNSFIQIMENQSKTAASYT